MNILSPKVIIEAYFSNNPKDKMLFHLNRIEKQSLIKNNNKQVPEEDLKQSIEYIRKEFGICFENNEYMELLNLYPKQKSILIENGFGYVTIKEDISDILANFFVGSKGLNFQDIVEKDLEKKFYKMIKQEAKAFGYKTK